MNLVFSDRVRIEATPAGRAEPMVRFLDQASGDYWNQVRNLPASVGLPHKAPV